MKPLAVLIGLGVLVGGGIAVAKMADKPQSVTLNHGAAYTWTVRKNFNGDLNDFQAMGFQSVTCNTEGSCQGIWGGADGVDFTPPPGMSVPVFQGYIAPPLQAIPINLTYTPNPQSSHPSQQQGFNIGGFLKY